MDSLKFSMKIIPLLCLSFLIPLATCAADTNLPPRLTVELRDGSRVVGTPAENSFRFHSSLGKLKLTVADLRSVECVSSNSAKLLTAGGDRLTVWFEDSSLAIKTGFGKIELPVSSIRKLTVSTPGAVGTRRPGLVALWSGEGDGKDSVGGHDAELTDISFADGKVGQAFSLEGDNAIIKIPANASLDVGTGSGFTICAWIKPYTTSKTSPIIEWVGDGVRGGTQFYIYPPHGGPGTLYAMLCDTDGNAHYFSAARAVVPDVFQHVALTYDKETGLSKIYCNGTEVAQQTLGSFTPQTSCNLYLGKRPLIAGETWQFNGLLDEAALYNRALSAVEIRDLCTEENNGELPAAPASSRPIFRRGNFQPFSTGE